MGIISRFFTGSGPRKTQSGAAPASVSNLRNEIEKLKTANESYRERLAQRIELNKTLKDTIDAQKAEMNALRINSRKDITLERIDTFFTGTKLRLPEEAYQRFMAKCEDKASPDKVIAFREEMEKTQHRAFYEQLFTTEMDMAQGFDFTGLRPIVTFQRGETDIAYAAQKGMTLDELKANHIRITIERFDEIIKKSFINPKRVKAVCEIGAAWGAATRYMQNRYKPDTFHVYEIDTGWAQWLKDNLGVDSKQCDGESLSETDDESMDICVASSCLYFMPFVKQWNYLTEFARVLKPGGIAVFNVNLIENTSVRTLKGLLANYFPRRSFGYIPQHCVDTAFPEDQFEKLVKDPTKGFGYQVYRKRKP
jgi:SAM-dependent methyltransferase